MPGSRSLVWRLWDKVLVGDGCWEFQGCRNQAGYGCIARGGGNGTMLAHRAAYLLWHGLDEIPEGRWVLHHCDNPPCCRPDHLYLGTRRDNYLDHVDRGRSWSGHNALKTHCPRGHPFDEANTYRRASGTRKCRACARKLKGRAETAVCAFCETEFIKVRHDQRFCSPACDVRYFNQRRQLCR